MTFNHRVTVTLSLDPALSRLAERLLKVLESIDAGMTPEEEAAFTRENNALAGGLENATRPDPKQ